MPDNLSMILQLLVPAEGILQHNSRHLQKGSTKSEKYFFSHMVKMGMTAHMLFGNNLFY
jgi:hypothetical protein